MRNSLQERKEGTTSFNWLKDWFLQTAGCISWFLLIVDENSTLPERYSRLVDHNQKQVSCLQSHLHIFAGSFFCLFLVEKFKMYLCISYFPITTHLNGNFLWSNDSAIASIAFKLKIKSNMEIGYYWTSDLISKNNGR